MIYDLKLQGNQSLMGLVVEKEWLSKRITAPHRGEPLCRQGTNESIIKAIVLSINNAISYDILLHRISVNNSK